MKIEMGESLIYSWLRHVKKCQLVQVNWKVSKAWDLENKDKLEKLMQQSHELFLEKYGYDLYGKNKLGQLLQQAEIDVLGLAHDKNQIYAVDIAFHENGLNYGKATPARVVKKCLRSAMCIYGYYGLSEATIIFTSPKIAVSIVNKIQDMIEDMQILLADISLNYAVKMITNDDFSEEILKPIRRLKGNVADTSELFMRSIQLNAIFDDDLINPEHLVDVDSEDDENDIYELKEKKIGELVQIVFRDVLERGSVDSDELEQLQSLEYSRETFHITFPLLQKERNDTNKGRYYTYPINIAGNNYYLCNHWFDISRPYVLEWIATHS